jgi:hypothetical protein
LGASVGGGGAVEVQNQNGDGDTGGGAISRGRQTAAARE